MSLSKKQTKKKEKIVKAMKRNTRDFKKRYGDDAKSVMYATATKLAKNESVEFAVSFPESISAHEFANKLKEYKISKNDYLSTHIDGSSTVMFESKIDNDHFIQWLGEKHNSIGVTLCYEEFLPIPSNDITGDNAITFGEFTKTAHAVEYDVFFAEERLDEADNAYMKTRSYKKMQGDKKEAVDYFMQQVEKLGIEKIDKAIKDTSVRYTISATELNKFLEDIFFTEDIEYFRSLAEADEDPMKKKVEKDREESKKEQKKESDDKKKEKADDKKEADKKREDASKESEKKKEEGSKDKEDSDGMQPQTKTFSNFKSDLKPNEKGKPSITNPEGSEKKVKLEKPPKGSPVEDAELDESVNFSASGQFNAADARKKRLGNKKDWSDDAEFLKLARKALTTGLPGSAIRKRAIQAFNVKRKEYGLEPIAEETEDKPLNKPFKTPGGPKKSAVYVKNEKGNTVKVAFGDPNMSIKKDQPGRKKSFMARHKCADKKDKTTAGYWSCKAWEDRVTESTLNKNISMLKSAGFTVKMTSGVVTASKEGPDKKDLNVALAFMKSSGFVEKQRFGKEHTNLNIAFEHPIDNETGFINYAAPEKAVRGNPEADSGEIFLSAGE